VFFNKKEAILENIYIPDALNFWKKNPNGSHT
jgi:hypothetical protein